MSPRVEQVQSRDELWDIVVEALVAKANDDVVDEDAVQDASALLVATMLMAHGVSEDTVTSLFAERDYTIRLRWDGLADEIGIEVDWRNGGEGDECWRCDVNPPTTNVGLCDGCLQELRSE